MVADIVSSVTKVAICFVWCTLWAGTVRRFCNGARIAREEERRGALRLTLHVCIWTQVTTATVLRIVCGAYERVLCGLDAGKDDRTGLWMIQPVFLYAPHGGCIKTLDIGGRFLASGSTDEIVKLYDLHKRVEVGSLLQHDGSITDLAFFGSSHLLSASEDGTLCVWRSSDWECLKTLKGHKGAVNSISVHPTGKLALSTGKDKTLRTWDLVQGRCAHTQRLASGEAEMVRWSPSGVSYAIVTSNTTATTTHSITCAKRVTALQFVEDNVLLIGSDDSSIRAHDTNGDRDLFTLTYHTTRIRGLAVCTYDGVQLLISISSDGLVCLWDLGDLLSGRIPEKPLASHNTSIRLTCLRAAVVPIAPTKRVAEPSAADDANPGAASGSADSPAPQKRKKSKKNNYE